MVRLRKHGARMNGQLFVTTTQNTPIVCEIDERRFRYLVQRAQAVIEEMDAIRSHRRARLHHRRTREKGGTR